MHVTAGRDPADDRAVVPDRLVADHVGRVVSGSDIDDERDELAGRTGLHLLFDRGTADEVVVELEVAVDARFERCVDRPVLTEPCAEVLLQPQRHEGPEAEQPDAVLLAGRHQRVEQRPLVLRRDPHLVAEIAAVRQSPYPSRDRADLDLLEVHELERRIRHVRVGDGLQHVTRTRPGQREADEAQPQDLETDGVVGRQMVEEPAAVVHLGGLRAEEEVLVLAGAGDRELADDAALRVQHCRERDPANFWHGSCQ